MRLLFIFLSLYLNMVPSGPDLVSNVAFFIFSTCYHQIHVGPLLQTNVCSNPVPDSSFFFCFSFFGNDQYPELSFLTYVIFAIDTHKTQQFMFILDYRNRLAFREI